MALYNYQAVSRDGKKVSGHIDASTTQGARELLVKQGLFPTKVILATEERLRSHGTEKSFDEILA